MPACRDHPALPPTHKLLHHIKLAQFHRAVLLPSHRPHMVRTVRVVPIRPRFFLPARSAARASGYERGCGGKGREEGTEGREGTMSGGGGEGIRARGGGRGRVSVLTVAVVVAMLMMVTWHGWDTTVPQLVGRTHCAQIVSFIVVRTVNVNVCVAAISATMLVPAGAAAAAATAAGIPRGDGTFPEGEGGVVRATVRHKGRYSPADRLAKGSQPC